MVASWLALAGFALLGPVMVAGTTKLQVQIPQTLRQPDGYDHRNALFGMLPYGGSIQQQVYYSPNKFCSSSASSTRKDEIFPKQDFRPEGPFVLMLDRGNCTFVTKVRNAQHFGAAAVLIADDMCQCDHEGCTPAYEGQFCESKEPMMADDGSGGDIGIPTFLLFKEDADQIKKTIKANQIVRVEMSFSIPNPDNRVEYDFWTRPGDSMSYKFLSEFKEIAVRLKRHALFEPHYDIYDGDLAGCRYSANGEENPCYDLCTNHGRYCAMDPDDTLYSGISGADVVTESLRRICIWSNYGIRGIGVNWWNYVQRFLSRCSDADSFTDPECIEEAYAYAGIDKERIELCMRDSGGLEGDQNNNKLDNELRLKREKGIVVVPTSFVNEAPVRGSMSPVNIFEAICSGYAAGSTPGVCSQCAHCPHVRECVVNGVCASTTGSSGTNPVAPATVDGSVSTHTFALSMVLLFCIFGGVGYWHYNRARQDMREQVRGILAEYVPLEDNDENGTPGVGGRLNRANFMPRNGPNTSMSTTKPMPKPGATGSAPLVGQTPPLIAEPMSSSLLASS